MSTVDNAIARLQTLALASTDLNIRHAPNKPSADATALPMAIAHLADGEADAIADWAEIRPVINVDFYFSAIDLRQAYTEIDACAVEYARRVAGDPKLNNTVDTIIFPISWTVEPGEYNSTPTLVLSFSVPVKTKEAKIT